MVEAIRSNSSCWICSLLVWFILIPVFLPNLSHATQTEIIPFSADVIRSSTKKSKAKPPPKLNQGRMFVGLEGIRTETSYDKQQVWMIFKPAQKIVWTIFPEQNLYMERTDLSVARPALPDEMGSLCKNNNFQCQQEGKETVNDRLVVRWSVYVKSPKGNLFYAKLWVDSHLKIAIREQYADGLTVEMRNIKITPQDSSLFQLPKGLKKIELPPIKDSQK